MAYDLHEISQYGCLKNVLCIMFAAWGDPKRAQNELEMSLSVSITLENGKRPLLRIFENCCLFGPILDTLTYRLSNPKPVSTIKKGVTNKMLNLNILEKIFF